jgi:pSer/pThr/pTyr-binding forkhead associated (FHA) protein
MAESPNTPHTASAVELTARLQAERAGDPFLVFRDGNGEQCIIRLLPTLERLSIGRRATTDLCLGWDEEISRLHAELGRVGGDWTLADEGLSRNGTWVNGQRLEGRQRMRDGDVIRVGDTSLLYRQPNQGASRATVTRREAVLGPADISDAQRRVLVALCRPFKTPAPFTTPATNQQIAAELFLTVDTVKIHLRALYRKFDVENVAQNQKRLRLVERALAAGLVTPRDL